jgi:hypothetical protein
MAAIHSSSTKSSEIRQLDGEKLKSKSLGISVNYLMINQATNVNGSPSLRNPSLLYTFKTCHWTQDHSHVSFEPTTTTMAFKLWIYIPVSHHSFFVNYSKLLYQGQYLQFFTNRYTLFWTLIAKLTQIDNARLSKSQAHKML